MCRFLRKKCSKNRFQRFCFWMFCDSWNCGAKSDMDDALDPSI